MGLKFVVGLMVFYLGTKMFIHGGYPTGGYVMLFGLGDLSPIKEQCHYSRNLSLGLVTKAKACKGASQEECERVSR
jgi:hypothetical protein